MVAPPARRSKRFSALLGGTVPIPAASTTSCSRKSSGRRERVTPAEALVGSAGSRSKQPPEPPAPRQGEPQRAYAQREFSCREDGGRGDVEGGEVPAVPAARKPDVRECGRHDE